MGTYEAGEKALMDEVVKFAHACNEGKKKALKKGFSKGKYK